MIGRYGEKQTPINKKSAIGAGMLDEHGRRAYGHRDSDISFEAKQVQRLRELVGVSLEIAFKSFKNQLDRFERKELLEAIDRRLRGCSNEDDSRFIRRVRELVDPAPAVPVKKRTGSAPPDWKETKVCPHCGKKRLNRDFLFCPMCGLELPQ